MNQIEIMTPRLILKSITPEVIHNMFNTQSKEAIVDYFKLDDKGYEHYKGMHEKGMETHRFSLFYFLLIEKEQNIPIGECGFHSWNILHRKAELFYVLRGDEHKHKGYMTEAVQFVLDYGYKALNLHRVEALVAEDNMPSIRILKRYGFKFEGVRREDYNVNGINENSACYSMLRWEWDV
ncbi:MAG TPA: GNAT family protein [Ferruginibacter sp.]|nr:GNAT family protein [Ferruginibacter sp.]HRO16863.1 GNAT family protein [Ferruginibacter sp.]HRQ20235.1 GNAT family protein [Ferruginibacter sp.]